MTNDENTRMYKADLSCPDKINSYEKLLAASPDAILFIDAKGQISLTSNLVETLFGYNQEELIGRNIDLLIPPRFRNHHYSFVKHFFESPSPHPMHIGEGVFGQKKNGEEFPIDIRLSLTVVDGRQYAFCSIRDITARIMAEEKIEREYHLQRVISSVLKISLTSLSLDEQLEQALEHILSIPDLSPLAQGAIYITDGRAKMTLRAKHGFGDEEDVPCPNIDDDDCTCMQAVKGGEIVFATDSECRKKRQSIRMAPHGHYCVPIRQDVKIVGLINIFLGQGHEPKDIEKHFLSVIADTLSGVIRHHEMEKEKETLLLQLAQAEKLAAMGRLTARFAHEIRNPLTTVGGFARRLLQNHDNGAKSDEYAKIIATEVERLEDVLENVLTISQPMPQPTSKHDVNDIIEYLCKMFEPDCVIKSIKQIKQLSTVPPIYIDSHYVRAAVENLIANAIESMPQGGVLHVGTSTEEKNGREYVCITVKDSGEGIPKERLDLIFEPFYTSKAGSKRSGLGLASTKKIVEEHGGFIQVDSDLGKGATFKLYFSIDGRMASANAGGMRIESQVPCSNLELHVLKSAVDNTNEAFITIDQTSKVIFYNKAAEKIFGYKPAEVIGRNLDTILSPECLAGHMEAVARFVRTEEPKLIGHAREFTAMRKNGETFPAGISFSVAKTGGKLFFTGIITDMSATKELEKQLEKNERLASLGQTVAEISHEIKNPLMMIGGFAKQLTKSVPGEKEQQKLNIIVDEAYRLENLLAELRDLYTPKNLEVEKIDINVLITEVLELIEPDLQAKAIRFKWRNSGKEVSAIGDRAKLKQVLLNVFKNSLDALANEGEMSIGVTTESDQIVIAVTDNGKGIPASIFGKICDPFFTTKKKGTGLGLAISKRIVEAHQGGKFTIKSVEGKGTEVEISLARFRPEFIVGSGI